MAQPCLQGSLDGNPRWGAVTLPSGSASIKTVRSLSLLSQGLGRVGEGQFPVSLKLLLGKKSAPTSAIGPSSSAWQTRSDASPSGTITQAAQGRQPLRRECYPDQPCTGSGQREQFLWHLRLTASACYPGSLLLCPGLAVVPQGRLTEPEWALWPVLQGAMCNGCSSSSCLRL